MLPVILAGLLAAGAAQPQPPSVDGDWNGPFAVNAAVSVRLILHLGDKSSLDSPDQGAVGLPANLTRQGDHALVDVPTGGLHFDLTLSPDGQTLSGVLKQNGETFPVALHRGAGALNRPQTPKPPFPYRAVDVKFPNPAAPGVTLAGTLTLPEGAGPFPAAVLITGSGTQDRDETIFDHKPFLLIADALTRRGIAVLRLDDRGAGGSTGATDRDTDDDFAGDVRADLAWLRARPDIDPARIGLIGHSAGGAIAVKVAAKDPKVGFVVMLAGPGVKGRDLVAEQSRLASLAAGIAPAVAAQNAAAEGKLLDIILADPNDAKAVSEVNTYRRSLGLPDATSELNAMVSPWYREFIGYDPGPDLAAIMAPILALDGDKDSEVSAAQNLPAIKAANPRAETVELPGLNHLFQQARTGAVSEYAQIEQTMAPEALNRIVDWVVKVTQQPRP